MTRLELLQLLGFVLVALALLILAATAATILYRRRADELEQWVAEQDADARAHAQQREQVQGTMPVRAVESPRPPSIDGDSLTRPLTVPRPPDAPAIVWPTAPPCGNGLDHVAHYFIDYVETADPGAPEMTRRPCPGVRSGPHRRA